MLLAFLLALLLSAQAVELDVTSVDIPYTFNRTVKLHKGSLLLANFTASSAAGAPTDALSLAYLSKMFSSIQMDIEASEKCNIYQYEGKTCPEVLEAAQKAFGGKLSWVCTFETPQHAMFTNAGDDRMGN
jgi:hypothetical protein